jgi:hypothetical protein
MHAEEEGLQPDLIKPCFEDVSAQKKQFTIEKSPLGPYVRTNSGLFLPDSDEEEESADLDYIINIQQHIQGVLNLRRYSKRPYCKIADDTFYRVRYPKVVPRGTCCS